LLKYRSRLFEIVEQAIHTAALDSPGAMIQLDPYNILAGFIFGTLGWGAFMYGKRLELWQPRAIGLALMLYPYFFSNAWLLWGVGVGLLVLLWFYHHE
jgi:hypothetical protein